MRKYNFIQKFLSSTLAISPLLFSARLFYSPFLFSSLPSSVLLILGVTESFADSALASSQNEEPLLSSPLFCSSLSSFTLPFSLSLISYTSSLLFYSALILSVLLFCTLPFPSPLRSLPHSPSFPCPLISSSLLSSPPFSSLLLSFFLFSCIFLLRLTFSFSTLFVIQFTFLCLFNPLCSFLSFARAFVPLYRTIYGISLWRRQGFPIHGS